MSHGNEVMLVDCHVPAVSMACRLVPEVQAACQPAIDRAEGRSVPLKGIERHAFYERTKQGLRDRRDR